MHCASKFSFSPAAGGEGCLQSKVVCDKRLASQRKFPSVALEHGLRDRFSTPFLLFASARQDSHKPSVELGCFRSLRAHTSYMPSNS